MQNCCQVMGKREVIPREGLRLYGQVVLSYMAGS